MKGIFRQLFQSVRFVSLQQSNWRSIKHSRFSRLILWLLLAMPGTTFPIDAQNPQGNSSAAQNGDKEQLKLVVILSRHGVRSPTWAQDRLDTYSALPWPKWSVAPGYLTPRGFDLVKAFGRFDRASFAKNGLVAESGCADGARTYIWADTDQRTMESGRAMAEGLFPSCPPAVHSLAAGENDPLFHPAHRGRQLEAKPVKTALKSEGASQPDREQSELLTEMQRVLMGCPPERACTSVHVPQSSLLGTPNSAGNRDGDSVPTVRGPLAQASSFAEDFLLEYAEGMPNDQVGWGRVDEPQLRRFLALHSENFDLTHRTTAAARLEASNMLFHILRTLDQGAEQRRVEDAVGPVNSEIVLLVGHDTNLAGVAALLGLHWTLDGRRDDTPPGTELAFELWQNERGTYTVRVTVAMQTLNQMRQLRELTLAAPPAGEVLMVQGCDAKSPACKWEAFMKSVEAVIDKNDIF
jgi:4-phytase/acid phosphatase